MNTNPDIIRTKIAVADLRCNKWLADGNFYKEAGDLFKAHHCYDKAQFWLDRRTKLEEQQLLLSKN